MNSSATQNKNFLPEDIKEKINNHPCYCEDAHHHYARIHAAVAPACNIQCNYCNRKYDCSNESRPGVTSERMTPKEAIKKVLYVGGEVQRLSVLGIAGPGDALANPKNTFETFRLVREKAPDLKLCLSTNGLALPDYVDELVKYGVEHLTVTINSIDETGEIGSKIYSWIYYNHKRYFGKVAAKILLERQIEGIKKCVEKGILIKVNSVLIPGINDKHLPKVVKKLKEMGAFLHNIMPLISDPKYGTKFGLEGVPSATPQQVMEVQKACGTNVRLMKHCRQCRADAVGLIGEDRGAKFTKDVFVNKSFEELEKHYNIKARKKAHQKIEEWRKILENANKKAKQSEENLSSNNKTILVAVTTAGKGIINQHFDATKEFLIYKAGDNGVMFVQPRRITREYAKTAESDNPVNEITDVLKDCKLLLTAKIDQIPKDKLKAAGITVDDNFAFAPIEASVLKATRKYFNLPKEMEAN